MTGAAAWPPQFISHTLACAACAIASPHIQKIYSRSHARAARYLCVSCAPSLASRSVRHFCMRHFHAAIGINLVCSSASDGGENLIEWIGIFFVSPNSRLVFCTSRLCVCAIDMGECFAAVCIWPVIEISGAWPKGGVLTACQYIILFCNPSNICVFATKRAWNRGLMDAMWCESLLGYFWIYLILATGQLCRVTGKLKLHIHFIFLSAQDALKN